MSDEFIKVATEEIKEEIAKIEKILDSCKNDFDVKNNSVTIEKHLHKIKGLAPMMGKSQIGEIALLNDVLLNQIIDGKNISGMYTILNESNEFMKLSIQNSDGNFHELKQKIETNYSNFLD